MYISDIITILRSNLPKYSNSFSEKVQISSISYAAGVVTVVTVEDHGLEVDQQITIVDCKQLVPIATIARVDQTATLTTSLDHDQTLDYASSDEQPDIEISGCSVAAYNGPWAPEDIPTRRIVGFEVPGAPADAIDGFLVEKSVAGYSGLKTVKLVIGPKTFTFETTKVLPPTGLGGYVHLDIRISGAIDIDRIIEAYSKHTNGNYWAFVVPDNSTASKSRQSENDSTYTPTKGDEFRQKLITPFDIFIFVPSKNDINGRASYDAAVFESVGIYKSLLGYAAPSPYTIDSFSKIIIEGHGPERYMKAYYVHRFGFSITDELVIDDTIDIENDVAFRDIDFDFLNDFDETIIENSLETDEE